MSKINEEHFQNVLRFWLEKGVDGFRMDALPHLMEVEDLRDEPLSGGSSDPNDYGYLNHIYTNSLPETYEMVRQWRDVLDEYESTDQQRVMMIEAYASLELTMKYYEYGAHFPFNFGLITSLHAGSSAANFKQIVDDWMSNLPESATSNWVVSLSALLNSFQVPRLFYF